MHILFWKGGNQDMIIFYDYCFIFYFYFLFFGWVYKGVLVITIFFHACILY